MKRGNPTQSVELNDLVKKLKKFEVFGVRISLKAVQQLEELEWEKII